MGTIVKDMPPLPGEEKNQMDDVDINNTNNNTSEDVSTASANLHNFKEPDSVANLSSPWEYNVNQARCTSCREEFNPINRRHHCRLCGKIFCNNCSDQRALIPPSSIVLSPQAGKHATPQPQTVSFTPDPDPDRMLTYLDDHQQLLYGKGLEERFQLAREPLRVCQPCWEQLLPLQEQLRNSNSNAMRFNHIDPTDPRRFFNSPLAFTLGHEIRKAAYTLNNWLPHPRSRGGVLTAESPDHFLTGEDRELQQCQEECQTIRPNMAQLDGLKIPARLLEEAKGIAVLTVFKGGFVAGVEFGTGLVVARLGEQQWSAPCAIGTAGVSWGALVGAQVSDHIFLLMTDAAVELMFSNTGNLQLGADIGIAVGPLGRSVEADVGASPGKFAPIYTYSLSKGLYAGISLDGKVLMQRERVNEKFYGRPVSGVEILSGQVPTPPAARPLYDALHRCHVYATGNTRGHPSQQQQQHLPTVMEDPQVPMVIPESADMEYGELPEPVPVFADTRSDMSDITTDPGY
eukprot:Nitzschia sp. Nitz4//scaffold16_size188269//18255//19893//NITZ4_001768-RA/size188269-augustus-gene-0.87-mRNA-1//-1//CDS//3329538446//1804//frame0